MKDLFQAQEILLHHVPETGEESIAVAAAFGRVISLPAGTRPDGEPLVKARHAVTASDIAVLTEAGIASISVRRLPTAGVATVGKVSAAVPAAVAAIAHAWGAAVERLAFLDNPLQEMSVALDRLDVLMVICDNSGALREQLRQAGAETLVESVSMTPGGELVVLRLHGKSILLSPPALAEALVIAEIFLGPALQSCQLRINNAVEPLKAELRGELNGDPARTVLAPVSLDARHGVLQARPIRPQDHPHTTRAYAILPPDVPVFDRHSIVEVIPLRGGLTLYT
jgi:molybdopterin biosynthesis enzyme